ncbi:MAG: hypothetical protein HZB30_00920 [Nitrospirae bacterium]|nr:hypothetical protein [Nitrospirota bacterium]
MKFAIGEDIIKNATKCRSNFSCLSGENGCLCEIEDFAGEKIHFIIPGNATEICDYRMGFGYSYLCNCPVRKEIYNQYKV